MPYRIPTTQENFDRNLSNYEAELNQTSPLVDKAFLRVQAANEAMAQTELSRLAVDRAKENLAITASEEGLTILGDELNIPRKAGTAANLSIFLTATVSTSIPGNTDFVGDSNNERYFTDATVVAATDPTYGDGALLAVTAKDVGTAGNLNVDDTLTLGSIIAGASSSAFVTAINTFGTDQEDLEAWRRRILNEIRTVGGGGNGADYRTWAERGDGVFRAFPYSARPLGSTSLPGDRTVYIEVDASIDPDGEANGAPGQAVLDSARDNINQNQTTEQNNPPLGTSDSSLYVESITRRSMFVEIRNLVIDASVEDAAKAQVDTSLDEYFRTITPFIEGTDILSSKNDIITDLTVSTIVQDALAAFGGSADGIGFGLEASVFISSYTLSAGELTRLDVGGATYA
ncbi:baseplate J/gp47 family protein [Candidatus Pacearchaeota archaeon]|nr:baseplate J/gp47 family protein [Candidatus Pacearchaeota archaeon]